MFKQSSCEVQPHPKSKNTFAETHIPVSLFQIVGNECFVKSAKQENFRAIFLPIKLNTPIKLSIKH